MLQNTPAPIAREPEQTIWLAVRDAAALVGSSARTLRRQCQAGNFRTRQALDNGGVQYQLALDSLPLHAQHRYWAQHLGTAHPPAARRTALEKLNLDQVAECEVARLAGITRNPRPLAPLPLTTKEAHAAQLAFERVPRGARQAAERRASILAHLADMNDSLPMMERYIRTAAEFGVPVATLRRWWANVKHLDRRDWKPALAPAWCGGRPEAELSPEAWEFIVSEWAVQSQPALRPIYRRAKREAAKNGWAFASYSTVKRRINALPATIKTLKREGTEALSKLFPAIMRNYSTLSLHDMWVSDGRKADVFCIWPDGHIGRPIVMAWQELRSRKVLGWKVDKVESAELARLSFHDAAKRSGAIPIEAYLDNGRAFASKVMTGGSTTRNRFKVREDEIPGVLTLLGVKPVWATPYHGQSKPIESFWNTVAQGERCAAFTGSYCGNRPDAKPEEFDAKRLVPIANYVAFVRETIEAKNDQEHRGDSMEGKSPNAVYNDLFDQVPVRHPTADQLRLCLMAAEQVKLDSGHGVKVLGNRYWSEKLAELPHRGPYTVRFDPTDAAAPVALYDGERFLGEARLFDRHGFRDMDAAKEHLRESKRMQRAVKDQAAASIAKERAKRSWEEPQALPPADGTSSAMPVPKIARMVRPSRHYEPKNPLPKPVDNDSDVDLQEYRELRKRALEKFAQERKKAVGGL